MEKWRIIPDHPDYWISSFGRIYSNKRNRELNLALKPNGYLGIELGRGKRHLVHRLVAITFLGIDPLKPWVNHKNGNRADNRVENIEWSTPGENILHKTRVLGSGRLARHPMARFSEQDVLDIRKKIQSGRTERALAAEYQVAHSTIHAIASGQNWKAL